MVSIGRSVASRESGCAIDAAPPPALEETGRAVPDRAAGSVARGPRTLTPAHGGLPATGSTKRGPVM